MFSGFGMIKSCHCSKATKLITAGLESMISEFEMLTFWQKIQGKIFADDIGIRLNWDRKNWRVDKSYFITSTITANETSICRALSEMANQFVFSEIL